MTCLILLIVETTETISSVHILNQMLQNFINMFQRVADCMTSICSSSKHIFTKSSDAYHIKLLEPMNSFRGAKQYLAEGNTIIVMPKQQVFKTFQKILKTCCFATDSSLVDHGIYMNIVTSIERIEIFVSTPLHTTVHHMANIYISCIKFELNSSYNRFV